MKGEDAIHKLLIKLKLFRMGDEVIFTEDVSFANFLDERVTVKKGSEGVIVSSSDSGIVLFVRGYSGRIFELGRDKLKFLALKSN